jgi:hypothetical protein
MVQAAFRIPERRPEPVLQRLRRRVARREQRRQQRRQRQQEQHPDAEQAGLVAPQLHQRAPRGAEDLVGTPAQEHLMLGGVLGLPASPPGDVGVGPLDRCHVTPA